MMNPDPTPLCACIAPYRSRIGAEVDRGRIVGIPPTPPSTLR